MYITTKLLSGQRNMVSICLCLFAGFVLAFMAAPPLAAQDEEEPGQLFTQQTCKDEGGTWNEDANPPCQFTDEAADSDPNFLIRRYINPLVAFLAGVVGLVVVISIVVGGIQYSSAGDDPQKVAKAKSRIINALIALLAFFLLFAFLEWILPGGIVN